MKIYILSYTSILIAIFILIFIITSSKYHQINRKYIKCDKYILENSSQYSTLYNGGFSDKYIRRYFFTSFKDVYEKYIDTNSIIVDVGSNKGDVTNQFYRLFPYTKIISIEPLEANYKHQLRLFNRIPNIKVFNYAISCKNYKSIIYAGKKVGYMHVKGEKNGASKTEQTIEFVTLDYFLNNIYVEGYEDDVIYGSIKLFAQKRVKYIFFEYHDKWCKTKLLYINKLLEYYGFDLYLLGYNKSVKIVDDCYEALSLVFPLHIFGCNNYFHESNKLHINYNNKFNKHN